MQIDLRHRSAVVGVAAMLLLAGGADADGLIQTTTPSSFGIYGTANLDDDNVATNLAQQFSLDSAFTLESLSFFGSGSNIDLYITDGVGTDSASVLWSMQDINAPGSRAWREVALGDLTLGAGEYFVVMASDDEVGGRWSLVTTLSDETVGIGADGVGTYEKTGPSQRAADLSYDFTPEDNLAYALTIDGRAIPSPGAITIAGFGGLIAFGRRRR